MYALFHIWALIYYVELSFTYVRIATWGLIRYKCIGMYIG